MKHTGAAVWWNLYQFGHMPSCRQARVPRLIAEPAWRVGRKACAPRVFRCGHDYCLRYTLVSRRYTLDNGVTAEVSHVAAAHDA